MKATVRPGMHSYQTTIKEMFRIGKACKKDVLEFPELAKGNPYAAYNYIRDLPFQDDPVGAEFVSRPSIVLWRGWNGPRDCDDKTTAIIAFCENFGYTYRIVVCGESENPADNPHHVYPEVFLEDAYVPFDTTYPEKCSLGSRLYNERYRELFYP